MSSAATVNSQLFSFDVPMLEIGFACEWSTPREKTWSHMPSSIFNALKARSDVQLHDIDIQLSATARALLKLRHLAYNKHLHRWTSRYAMSALHTQLLASTLQSRLKAASRLDALISFSDYAPVETCAQYIYFDMCAAELQRVLSHPRQGQYESVQYSRSMMDAKVQRQRETYRRCRGLFAMSAYAARTACEFYDISPDRVHVVHSGVNVQYGAAQQRPRKKDFILFVGRDFARKGGFAVLQAFQLLQEQLDVELVIAGPSQWVLGTTPPKGVVFVGDADRAALAPYFRHARLFVMPSYYEAYGIVFAEALCNGVPIIARNAFAMPEIVQHGVNGYLLPEHSESPAELAELMSKALKNSDMKTYSEAHMRESQSYHSWDRVAADIVRIVETDRKQDLL